VDFAYVEPTGAVGGFQQAVAAREAAVLGALLSGNGSQVTLMVDGFVAVAAKSSREDLEAAGGLGVEAEGDFSVKLPGSIFGSLETLGIFVDGIAMVATSMGSSVNSFFTANDTFDGRAVDVKASLNLNLYSGDGGKLSVYNLTDPITFSLEVEDASNTLCAVWDDDLQAWVSDGLTEVLIDGKFTCTTSHLSFFAGIARGFLNALKCSQASLLSAEGFEGVMEGDWYLQFGALVFFASVLFLIVMMAAAIRLDLHRCRHQKWNDELFIIVDHPDEEEPEEEEFDYRKHCCTHACLVGCLGAAAVWTEVAASAFRDVLDDILSGIFEHFGTLREMAEGAYGVLFDDGVEVENAGAGMAVALALTKMARRSLHETAHLNARAAVGLHRSDAINDVVVDLGLQQTAEPAATPESEGNIRSESDGSKIADSSNSGNSRSVSTRTPQKNEDSQGQVEIRIDSSGVSETADQNATESENARRVQSAMLKGRTTADIAKAQHKHEHRAKTLSRYHEAQHARLQHEEEKIGNLCRLFAGSMYNWLKHGPIGSVYMFSFSASSSLRCLYLISEFLGSMMVTTLFMSVSGGSRSRKNPQECNADEDISEMIGRLLAVGVASGLLAAFPVTFMGLFHKREFVHVPYEYGKAWRKQLRKWRIMDIIGWTFGVCYVVFCLTYITLFFANVAAADHSSWLVAAGMSALEDLIIIPMAGFLAPVIFAVVSILLLMAIHRRGKAFIVKLIEQTPGSETLNGKAAAQGDEEVEPEDGNREVSEEAPEASLTTALPESGNSNDEEVRPPGDNGTCQPGIAVVLSLPSGASPPAASPAPSEPHFNSILEEDDVGGYRLLISV